MRKSTLVAANTATFSAPLPVVVDAVKAAGFDGLEVWNSDIDALPGGATTAASLLGQADIQVATFQLLRDYEGSGAGRDELLDEAEAMMDVMAALGAQTLLMCANTDASSSGDQGEQIGDLRVLADLAKARNIRIGFEPLAWSQWIYDYELACACVAAVDHPNFGLVLDVFHLFSRNTPLDVLDRISMNKLFLVQLSNAAVMPLATIEIARHHRLMPSEGEWPVAEVVQDIESRGFDGFYSIEVFNDEYRRQGAVEVATAAYHSFCQLFDAEPADARKAVNSGANMNKDFRNNFGMVVSRRTLLKAIAAGPVALASSDLLAQQNMTQKPKLAIVSRHLQWTDWQTGLELAKAVGYPGIVWSVRRGAHVDPENVARDLPEIVAATRAAGLEVPMIITRIGNVSEPHIESMLETFSSLGISRYRAGTPRYDYSKSFPGQYDAFRKELEALANLNAKYGVTACFHTHSSAGSLGGVGWDLWMVMKDLDPRYIGINFDIGHIVARTGVGWRDIAYAARDHIQSVSLKDVKAWVRQENPRSGNWPWGREFVPPGEGMVAFDDFFKLLYETNFSGPMEVYHEYRASIPGSDARLNMLGTSYGEWDLEVPLDYYESLLARDVRFYKTALRGAGYEI